MSRKRNKGVPSGTAGQRLFARYAELVLRRRAVAVLVVVLATAVAGVTASKQLRVDKSREGAFDGDDKSHAVLEAFRDAFGQDDLFLVVVEGDVFTPEYLRRLAELHAAVAALDVRIDSLGERRADRDRRRDSGDSELPTGEPRDRPSSQPEPDGGFQFESDTASDWQGVHGTVFDEITSLINARRTVGTSDGVVVGEWMDPLPQTDARISELRDAILADPSLQGRLIGQSGRHSVIALRSHFMSEDDSMRIYDALVDVTAKHTTEGFTALVGGPPALYATYKAFVFRDTRRLIVLCFAVMLLVLAVLFRHVIGVVAPIAAVIAATAWTFGLMAAAAMPLTVITTILPAFIVSVGIGDAVHILSMYRDLRKQGVDNHRAIVESVAKNGMPCLLTSLTTMVGLLSFNVSSVATIRHLGTAGATGVFAAFINCFILIPVVLSFNKRSLLGVPGGVRRDMLDRFVGFASGLSRIGVKRQHRYRRLVIALCAMLGLAVFAGLGVPRVEVRQNRLKWFPQDHTMVRAFDTIDRHVGGTASVNLLINTRTATGIGDLRLLRQLEALETKIRGYKDPVAGPLVTNSYSVLNVLRETNKSLHGDDPSEYRLPDSDRGASDVLFVFENAAKEELGRLVTSDLRTAHLSFRIRWIDATGYASLIAFVNDAISSTVDPSLATIEPTGTVLTHSSLAVSLIQDLSRSFLLALSVILGILILVFRRVSLGLVAMIPNLLPIVGVLGLLGWLDIPIRLSTCLFGTVALGLIVDDTIHFFHHFRTAHSPGGDGESAIAGSLHTSGRAIIVTSIVLTLGFMVYLGATMLFMREFAIVTATALLLALVSDLIFGPALLRAYCFVQRVRAPRNKP